MGKAIQFPNSSPDVQTIMLDDKPETMLSARGVLLFYLSSWKIDKNEIAHNGLRKYCEYLAMHGYGQGAEKILHDLDGMNRAAGIVWVKSTFAKYVQDQWDVMQYVLQR